MRVSQILIIILCKQMVVKYRKNMENTTICVKNGNILAHKIVTNM